jgi:hypothetical protein
MAIAAVAVVACSQRTEPVPKGAIPPVHDETTAKPTSTQPSAGVTEPADAPASVDVADLDTSEKAHYQKAKAAQMALGSTLMKTLKAAVAEQDYGAGIAACQGAAPVVAEEVAKHQGVAIGRTSFKVRNPNNAPPAWAQAFVDQRVDHEVVLRGPDGQIRVLSPIKVAEPCLTCHGSAEQIPSEVKAKLTELYPEDQATGFAAGDLRGWFWVQVPAS